MIVVAPAYDGIARQKAAWLATATPAASLSQTNGHTVSNGLSLTASEGCLSRDADEAVYSVSVSTADVRHISGVVHVSGRSTELDDGVHIGHVGVAAPTRRRVKLASTGLIEHTTQIALSDATS